jgi:hypothetical protein
LTVRLSSSAIAFANSTFSARDKCFKLMVTHTIKVARLACLCSLDHPALNTGIVHTGRALISYTHCLMVQRRCGYLPKLLENPGTVDPGFFHDLCRNAPSNFLYARRYLRAIS